MGERCSQPGDTTRTPQLCFLREWEELLAWRCGALRTETVTVVPRGCYCEWRSHCPLHLYRVRFQERSGGLKQLRQENKVVHQYKSANVERFPVRLLDKYISKLPPDAKKNDAFYLKPKANTLHDPMAPWFLNVPVERNTLAGMMKTMALKGSLDKTVTNHSLRAFGVTKMFQCQIPEKLIMEHSGHRSLQGLHQYERTTDSQEMQVCQILDSTKREYGMPSMVQEVSHRWPLSQQTSSAPAFSSCSFTNCTFQIALPPQPQTSTEDFSDVNIADFLHF